MQKSRNELLNQGYKFVRYVRTFDGRNKIIGELYTNGIKMAMLKNNGTLSYKLGVN